MEASGPIGISDGSTSGGAASGSSSMVDDLTCPICLDWFSDAVETHCGHAFCCACLLQVVSSAAADDELPRCPSCRSPVKMAHHSRTLQRTVTSARQAALAAPSTRGSRAGGASTVRQRRGASASADVDADAQSPPAEVIMDAAQHVAIAASNQDNARELASALYRIRLRAVDSGLLSRSWTFHQRTMCCIDIRTLTALVCATTIAINLMLWRLQSRKELLAEQPSFADGALDYLAATVGLVLSAAASNVFSIFAYVVGLLAVWFQDGALSHAFFYYASADTVFAVLPTTIEMVALGLHPDTVFASGPAGAGGRKLLASALTLAVNLAYNLPCLRVASIFSECFELRTSANDDGGDSREGEDCEPGDQTLVGPASVLTAAT